MDEDKKESTDENEDDDEESEDNLPSDSSNERNDVSDTIDSSRTESLRHSVNGYPYSAMKPKTEHNPRLSNIYNPPASWDFGTSFSTASEMSLYQSALDLQDFMKLDPRGSVHLESVPLSNNEVLQGIAEETTVNTPVTPVRMICKESDLYFRDGIRRIDHVLAYNTKVDDHHAKSFGEIRKAFETNLLADGLHLEYEFEEGNIVHFVKIHAPWEVLTRYAEIMKLKMPMKELQKDIEVETPTLVAGVKSAYNKVSKAVTGFDDTVFPPLDKRISYQFSREKEYLFDIPQNKDDFFTQAQRSLIVHFILKRTSFSLEQKNDFSTGIIKLLGENVYTAAYPLHEGQLTDPKGLNNPRGLLKAEWASFSKILRQQPLDHIRHYLGVKSGLYFAWLGFYTKMLIPASIVGLVCFIYGLATVDHFIPSQETCNKTFNIVMCPVCDKCDYWMLDETCQQSRITYLFDNPATIVFTVFMSFWSTLFLELWKRYSANITHRWDLSGFDLSEAQPRPQYLARLAKLKKEKAMEIFNRTEEPKISFWKWKFPVIIVSSSVVLLMVTVAIAAVIAVIVYRISVMTALSLKYDEDDDGIVNRNAPLITTVTSACINLFCILILNQAYGRLAEMLTELEMHRTQPEYDDSLTLKIFLLQFVNYYASIFYIAFVKGRLIGYPGNYSRLFGKYRHEECAPGGCLMELSIQLAIVMIGKQTINNIFELALPKLTQVYNALRHKIAKKVDYVPQTSWEKDYNLIAWTPQGLFSEYLEMVLQFGFVTIFAAAFPLAPIFALLNNLFEIRLDARKILTYFQRPTANRVKNIGVWYRILDGISKLAVITNAFIIAFTSNFIPRIVYKIVVNEEGTLTGFLEHSLSVFNVSEYPENYVPKNSDYDVEVCRYEDYRQDPSSSHKYMHSHYYWHILAARLAFIVVFENIVVFSITLLRWLIPDVPSHLKQQMRKENHIVNEIIVRQEFIRARGELLRNNPRLIRFASCEPNHIKSSLKKRPNSESLV